MKLYLHENIVSENLLLVFHRNIAKIPLKDDSILIKDSSIGVPIEENENGNILIEQWTCNQSKNNYYFRIYLDKKSKTSNWIKKFKLC